MCRVNLVTLDVKHSFQPEVGMHLQGTLKGSVCSSVFSPRPQKLRGGHLEGDPDSTRGRRGTLSKDPLRPPGDLGPRQARALSSLQHWSWRAWSPGLQAFWAGGRGHTAHIARQLSRRPRHDSRVSWEAAMARWPWLRHKDGDDSGLAWSLEESWDLTDHPSAPSAPGGRCCLHPILQERKLRPARLVT